MNCEIHRVLDHHDVVSLVTYRESGGMTGLNAARFSSPVEVIELVEASGLRGRGGSGFPTATKWRTVRDHASQDRPTTVVINGAEGEPGCYKDRTLLLRNPYKVLEGGLIAAHAVGARSLVVAMKHSAGREIERVRAAIDEFEREGWPIDVEMTVFTGPSAYLLGEETGLLEAIEGRPPFPRITPPFRRGLEEISTTPHPDLDSASAADLDLATPFEEVGVPPALVNNVETLANIPSIIANGAEWFREHGTDSSPGTLLVTISGSTQRASVIEVAMGTTLRDAIAAGGGGERKGRRLTGAMSGVSNPIVLEPAFDTPLTYEAMSEIDSGLGAAGFIVFDDSDEMLGVAQAISHFLATESCGQCVPCKRDGIALSEALSAQYDSPAAAATFHAVVQPLIASVADGARCNLARQQQLTVNSILQAFPQSVDLPEIAAETLRRIPFIIAPIVDITEGVARFDEGSPYKQFDWTFNATNSDKVPAESLDADTRDALQ